MDERKKDCVLVLDVGTSSMRGGVYGRAGELYLLHQVQYEVCAARDGRVEQDPAQFLRALEEIAGQAKDFCRTQKLRLRAVSAASQRSSLIAVDKDGAPLRSAIMWQDKRTRAICDEVNAALDTYAICGMKATTVYMAPKMLWLRRNQPELYEKAHKLLGIHELLLHRMTGRFVTDFSVASRSCLLDLQKLDWSEPLLAAFSVEREKLCALLPPGSVCGRTTPEFTALLGCDEAIPVVSAGGDQQCAALGLGVTEPGIVSVNCGTGAYVAALAERPVFDPAKNVVCNVSAIPGRYLLEASTLASGMVYSWFNKQFYRGGDYREADAEAAASPPGAGGVLALPDLMGRGMPDWDSNARGVFYNVGFHTTRGDLARAVMEGLAAELGDCMALLKALGLHPQQVTCSGGLSKNPLFCQIQADIYGVPVSVQQGCEATLHGAWSSAAAALGWYGSIAQAARTGCGCESRRHTPDLALERLYQNANAARHMLYKALDTAQLGRLLGTLC